MTASGKMRRTLRRSCEACARSKHGCDLRTPRCSRCIKRKIQCAYVNEPLTWSSSSPTGSGSGSEDRQSPRPEAIQPGSSTKLSALTGHNRFGGVDPFDSYPKTRFPRDHVQRLMHGFLRKIAFQYYPLDLDASSNPFLVSWWPLALDDPALFHISLQTACLDEELLAQKGFRDSELLMADSVTLLRRKISNSSLAMQDGTMNSVITLAAIEFGKGNVQASLMHVDGVKRIVDLRGGIDAVRRTSPLTARMVSWVSMIITCRPQFETQDDHGAGSGVSPIPEWHVDLDPFDNDNDELAGLDIDADDIDSEVRNVFIRLRRIFLRSQQTLLLPTQFHDLTCFTVHRLLSSTSSSSSSTTECIRHGMALYMLVAQGPTYFPHTLLASALVGRLLENMHQLEAVSYGCPSLEVWLTSVGMAASIDTAHHHLFAARAEKLAELLSLGSWVGVLAHLRRVLWLDGISRVEEAFRRPWQAFLCGEAISFDTVLEFMPQEYVTNPAKTTLPPISPVTDGDGAFHEAEYNQT